MRKFDNKKLYETVIRKIAFSDSKRTYRAITQKMLLEISKL